jgi:hypothetical protein
MGRQSPAKLKACQTISRKAGGPSIVVLIDKNQEVDMKIIDELKKQLRDIHCNTTVISGRVERLIADDYDTKMLREISDEIWMLRGTICNKTLEPYSPDELIVAVIDKLKKHDAFNTNKDIAETCATLMNIVDKGYLFMLRRDKEE